MTKVTSHVIIFIAILVLTSTVPMTSQADTYRWVDENGIVNYAERKPRGVPDDRIVRVASESKRGRQSDRSSTSSPSTPTSNPGITAQTQDQAELNPQQQDMLRGLQQAEVDRQAQVAQIKQDNCERARRVLDNLTAKDRIRVRSETGIERVLPEDERQEKIAAAQRGIVENCGA
jgi:hypothetical protein